MDTAASVEEGLQMDNKDHEERDVLRPLPSVRERFRVFLESLSEPLTIKEVEEVLIREAIHRNEGSVSRAAKQLGIGRATLYRRLGHMDKSFAASFR